MGMNKTVGCCILAMAIATGYTWAGEYENCVKVAHNKSICKEAVAGDKNATAYFGEYADYFMHESKSLLAKMHDARSTLIK